MMNKIKKQNSPQRTVSGALIDLCSGLAQCSIEAPEHFVLNSVESVIVRGVTDLSAQRDRQRILQLEYVYLIVMPYCNPNDSPMLIVCKLVGECVIAGFIVVNSQLNSYIL